MLRNFAEDLDYDCDGCGGVYPGHRICIRRFYGPLDTSVDLELCKSCDDLLLRGLGDPESLIRVQRDIERLRKEEDDE